jgi:urease accessory protein
MTQFKASKCVRVSRLLLKPVSFLAVPVGALSVATPAFAHHAMGGGMPSNLIEGFLSGIAHPLIGPDHFAFIVSVGLLAATRKRGIVIPVAFVLAAMVGTGMHLAKLNVPGIELFVSGSIMLFGVLLAMKNTLSTVAVTGLSILAGLFHGYAYGEAIFGAQMTPLLAYLIGFTVIQLGVSLAAFWIGTRMIAQHSNPLESSTPLNAAGLVICGVGLAFFITQVVGTLFPLPGA